MLPARKPGAKRDADIRKDAMEKIDLLGIASEAHKRATMISGGQKQRVAIARALINEPLIIMGDEPTGTSTAKIPRTCSTSSPPSARKKASHCSW